VGMRVIEQRFRDERTVREFERDLERHRRRGRRRSVQRASDHCKNVLLARAVRDSQLPLGKSATQASHALAALGGQQGEGRTLQSRDDFERRVDRGLSGRLDLEVEADSPESIQ